MIIKLWKPENPDEKISAVLTPGGKNGVGFPLPGELITEQAIGDESETAFPYLFGELEDKTKITIRSVASGSSGGVVTANGSPAVFVYAFAEYIEGHILPSDFNEMV